MEQFEAAIIIPAWNEEATISTVVHSVLSYGIVIVVDDCSIDETGKMAKEAGAVVVSHAVNKGYDEALNTGFKKALNIGCKYAITFDADGQHESKMVEVFLDKLESGADIVLGVRPQTARLAEYFFALYTRVRFRISDPLCGMKGYRLSVYQKRGWFDATGSIGTELTLWAISSGYKYIQVPINISARSDLPRFGQIFRANIKILKALVKSLSF